MQSAPGGGHIWASTLLQFEENKHEEGEKVLGVEENDIQLTKRGGFFHNTSGYKEIKETYLS